MTDNESEADDEQVPEMADSGSVLPGGDPATISLPELVEIQVEAQAKQRELQRQYEQIQSQFQKVYIELQKKDASQMSTEKKQVYDRTVEMVEALL